MLDAIQDAPPDDESIAGPTWTYALAGTVGAGVAGAMLGLWMGGADLWDWQNRLDSGCVLSLGPVDLAGTLVFVWTMLLLCGLTAGLLPGLGLSFWARGTFEVPGLIGWLVALAAGYGLILPVVFHAVATLLPTVDPSTLERGRMPRSLLPDMIQPDGSRILDTARWLLERPISQWWVLFTVLALVAAPISAWLHHVLVRQGRSPQTDFVAIVLAGGLAAAIVGTIFGAYVTYWFWDPASDQCVSMSALALVFIPLGAIELVLRGVAAGLFTAVLHRVWRRGWMMSFWLVGYLATTWTPLRLSADTSLMSGFLDFGSWQERYPRGATTVAIFASLLYVILAPVMLRLLVTVTEQVRRAG